MRYLVAFLAMLLVAVLLGCSGVAPKPINVQSQNDQDDQQPNKPTEPVKPTEPSKPTQPPNPKLQLKTVARTVEPPEPGKVLKADDLFATHKEWVDKIKVAYAKTRKNEVKAEDQLFLRDLIQDHNKDIAGKFPAGYEMIGTGTVKFIDREDAKRPDIFREPTWLFILSCGSDNEIGCTTTDPTLATLKKGELFTVQGRLGAMFSYTLILGMSGWTPLGGNDIIKPNLGISLPLDHCVRAK